jgi:hypothetical protein
METLVKPSESRASRIALTLPSCVVLFGLC